MGLQRVQFLVTNVPELLISALETGATVINRNEQWVYDVKIQADNGTVVGKNDTVAAPLLLITNRYRHN